MGLPEYVMERYLNGVTQIKDKYFKHESNQIKKLSRIQSNNVSWIKSETTIQIKLETVTSAKLPIMMTELALNNS